MMLKVSFFLLLLTKVGLLPAMAAGVGQSPESHQECVDEAQRKYDSCMELATEILAEAPQKGLTTTQHTLEEGRQLQEGGCKKMFDKDIKNCPKQ